MREEQTLAEIEDFLEGFKQPTYRGIRVNGVRVPVWSSLPDRAERRGKGYVGVAIGKPSTKSFFRRKR